MGLATTTLRIGLGAVMAGHGLQKLAGKFGGAGLDATGEGFEKMGLQPGRPYATAAGLSETVGGGLIAAGFHTPAGASMVTGAMTVAIGKVHGRNGPWITKGGYEYNLLIMAAAFALTEQGASFPAIDGLIVKKRKGLLWAILELVAGVAGGLAVLKLADRRGPASYAALASTNGADDSIAPATSSDAVTTIREPPATTPEAEAPNFEPAGSEPATTV